MIDALAKILKDNRLLSLGERVLVALSGGPDSMALLYLLREISQQIPLTVFAAHLDHGIRSESSEDANFVRRMCADLNVPLTCEFFDVPAIAREKRLGLEAAGRQARREFLEKTARCLQCSVIALGHHRSDQAETFLHRLMRGSGLSGLAAMRLRSGPYIRPLLSFPRSEILDYLALHGIPFVQDGSNDDPAYTRNRIRHGLIPLMASFNPRLEEHLSRICSRIAVEEDYWRSEEERAMAALAAPAESGVVLDRQGLLALHPALRMRVIRRALENVRGDLQGLDAVHLESVSALLAGTRPNAERSLPGVWAARRYERLYLRRTAPAQSDSYVIPIPGPGVFSLPGEGFLRVEINASPAGENCRTAEFDALQIEFPLLVRNFAPGDRFRPFGMSGTRKLKDFFIDEKIDPERRCHIPLITEREILWIGGHRRCAGYVPKTGGGPVLRLSLLPEAPTIPL